MSAKRKAPPPLARLFSDHALRDEVLQFEFEGFAKTLAELALNPENATPFTVAVKGSWGRGKTTLLRRAQWMMENPVAAGIEHGDRGRTVKTLWFNAWKYSNDDTVLAGLLGQLLDRLGRGDLLDQIKEFVARYKSSAMKKALGLALPGPFGDFLNLNDRYQEVTDQRAFLDSFRDLFTQASRLLFEAAPAFRDQEGLPEEQRWSVAKQRRETVAVFLDDLDRCRPERVVEVLEAINLFLDLPGVCFFLGIDWDRLVSLLPETVEGHEEQFLEKIVQVAFDLPRVSTPDAEKYMEQLIADTGLVDSLVEAATEGDAASDTALGVLASELEPLHPRHMKRFLNDLSMSLAVMRNTGRLGAESPKVSANAVVAWHLLAEVLPAGEWAEVRSLTQNLDRFLDGWSAEAKAGDGAEVEGVTSRRMAGSGLKARCLAVLKNLDPTQRHVLVHVAAPPQTSTAKARPQAARASSLEDPRSADWVEIAPETFLMGSQERDAEPDESPTRQVALGGYHMARYPVTNVDYAAYVEATGREWPEHWSEGGIPRGKERHPVVQVSWRDAQAYCSWLTERFRAMNHQGVVALPTEAQWEFAARGEEGRTYPWGNEEATAERANFGGAIGDTTIVDSYRLGRTPDTEIYDLAGNVWEWCADWYGRYPAPSETPDPDPAGAPTGDVRVLRGGAFYSVPRGLRASYRYSTHPELRSNRVGFRVVWRLPE